MVVVRVRQEAVVVREHVVLERRPEPRAGPGYERLEVLRNNLRNHRKQNARSAFLLVVLSLSWQIGTRSRRNDSLSWQKIMLN